MIPLRKSVMNESSKSKKTFLLYQKHYKKQNNYTMKET